MKLDIDFENLRVDENTEIVAETELNVEIRVQKPPKQKHFMTHPDPDMRIDTYILDYQPEGQSYLVAPKLWPYLQDELNFVKLVTCVDLDGEVFIWPIKMPGPDGRRNPWNASALAAADAATKQWVRLVPNQNRGKYIVKQAKDDLKIPEWPEESLQSLFEQAFGEFQITDLEHPVVKKLRGQQ